jgi:hypothetical protein
VAVNPDDQEANMAYFKHQQFFQQNHNHVFDLTAHPGAATPLSGIYRCEGCGREVAGIGVRDSEANLRNKISRGGFTGAFLIQCLVAMGVTQIRLDD